MACFFRFGRHHRVAWCAALLGTLVGPWAWAQNPFGKFAGKPDDKDRAPRMSVEHGPRTGTNSVSPNTTTLPKTFVPNLPNLSSGGASQRNPIPSGDVPMEFRRPGRGSNPGIGNGPANGNLNGNFTLPGQVFGPSNLTPNTNPRGGTIESFPGRITPPSTSNGISGLGSSNAGSKTKFPGAKNPNSSTFPLNVDPSTPNLVGPRVPNLGGKSSLDMPRRTPPITRLNIGKNGQLAGPGSASLVGKIGLEGRDPKVALPHPKFNDRLKSGDLDRLTKSGVGRRLDLGDQFRLFEKGDVARQLGLMDKLTKGGGWRNAVKSGPVATNFAALHFGGWYSGCGAYPAWCWYPHWHDWVSWCWWDFCDPFWDPRPIGCIPWHCHVCDPCPIWVVWDYPVWTPLPFVCGTWLDLPVVVADDLDLQLLAVRFVDPGHPEQQLGPRYRVWFRNTSRVDILSPFNVLLMAGNDRVPRSDLPQSGVRIPSMKADEIRSVDIRLPFSTMRMARDAQGREVPFAQLHVLVDSHREIPEAFEPNNGAVLARGDVLPVDPAAFSTNVSAASPGDVVNIAGEGFGPEPGQVLVFVKGLEMQAEIVGWFDLGIRVKLPSLLLAESTTAEIVVVRGDGAAANAVTVALGPAGSIVPPPPELPTP